ncbi:MAG TPA: hypothetical protein VH684_01010 [Xanthobacteraceae bacterium]|jgi:hypothetical protein
MLYRNLIGIAIISLCLSVACEAAAASDDGRYPDLKGQWSRFNVPGVGGQPSYDQTKLWGLGQQAPLIPEYQARAEASVADQAAGGQGGDGGFACRPYGMPRMMNAYSVIELIVMPETTYILINSEDHGRRIFTDSRDWPNEIDIAFQGYSIGKWIDENGDGRYNVLEAETRGFKGPRTYDATGLPLHLDNQSLFKERIYLDKADPNLLHDEITVFDHALTRPWSTDKKFRRSSNPRPNWHENFCTENNNHVVIGRDMYMLSADGRLMPARKGQPAPDLGYFKPSSSTPR